MYSRSLLARAVNLRGRPGASAARASGAPGPNHADRAVLGPKLDAARDEVKGALVGIAFLEQEAATLERFDLRLAREGVQVFRFQSVERGKTLEYGEIEGSFIHRNLLENANITGTGHNRIVGHSGGACRGPDGGSICSLMPGIQAACCACALTVKSQISGR